MRVMGGPHRHHAGRPAGPGGNREAATGAPRRQVRERVLGKLKGIDAGSFRKYYPSRRGIFRFLLPGFSTGKVLYGVKR